MRVVVQWLPETGTVFVVVVFEGDWRHLYRNGCLWNPGILRDSPRIR